MDELKTRFPQGVDWSAVYDPTVFVRDSIREVIRTLLEATLMVVIVVVLFLQTWRASVIPLAAVPVSIVGTFAVMLASGFSVNTLSLFGLVLAIGIVVDDAIVVVENVERHIEEGLSPLEASHRAMEEVSGPIIAIALVLCAVFVPVAFISGLTGQFYRQFALTIAFSTLISALQLAHALAGARGGAAQATQRARGSSDACDEPHARLAVRAVQSRIWSRGGSLSQRRRAAWLDVRRSRSRCTAVSSRWACSGSRKSHAVSCPVRTSSTSWPSPSCLTPRRSIARRPLSGAWRTSCSRNRASRLPSSSRGCRSTASRTNLTPVSSSSHSSRSTSGRRRS
jgi:hypothetical protein